MDDKKIDQNLFPYSNKQRGGEQTKKIVEEFFLTFVTSNNGQGCPEINLSRRKEKWQL